ncbi:hypothetical protein CH63R_01293 [Colletotrichum higginsianum IMI 349063]|uniref:Uncharacterized protein n=2 Tax=Colletotrichum higginsianum TaxID=80884 RepID=A0A1B7YVR5_COLHI|nr:hypothetical protein CH63R_01293 [Colletotrichum higginsianum IMI 349063]OBR16113.1 hypothetical protein CH63R_01293 [Colletotrichum higginsianum IMI 349063]TID05194.1 hypothetical protein CH35J_002164 [Colletotrichum higginsianum]GJC91633.1 hypothetical protein ColKHC_00459 [Colletotrichum higginsianum]
MHERDAQCEAAKVAVPSIEGSSPESRCVETNDIESASPEVSCQRELDFREEASALIRLLLAWIIASAILLAVRDFSVDHLTNWGYRLPTCNPTTKRRKPNPYRSEFLPPPGSCEVQIAQMVVLEVSFWINAFGIVFRTSTGRKRAGWAAVTTIAAAFLVMAVTADPVSSLLLAMPVVFSVFEAFVYVADVVVWSDRSSMQL